MKRSLYALALLGILGLSPVARADYCSGVPTGQSVTDTQLMNCVNRIPGSGTGSVTSVGLSSSGSITITGSPITTSGTLTADLASVSCATLPALIGDIATSAGSCTTAIQAGAVDLTDFANIAANSLLGNATGSPAAPTALTALPFTVPVTSGGTGIATATLGDLRYGSGTNTLAAFAGNTTTVQQFLSQTGNGTVSAAPVWFTLPPMLWPTAVDVTSFGIGTSALSQLTATPGSYYDTAVGVGAMAGVMTTGAIHGTAVGWNALHAETTGGNNTAVGYGALLVNTTGAANTAVGASALSANLIAAGGTAVGYSALSAATGLTNTALGYQAGKTITTGTNNLILGENVASTTLTTGGSNVLIGNSANCTSDAAGTGDEVKICTSSTGLLTITGGATPSTSAATFAGSLTATGALTASGGLVSLSIPIGTATFAVGTNVTSVVCATGYSCNNTRGTLTIVGGTATTGTIAVVSFSAALSVAPSCVASMNGGATVFDIGNSAPSTTAFNITAGVTVVGATFTVNYVCQP